MTIDWQDESFRGEAEGNNLREKGRESADKPGSVEGQPFIWDARRRAPQATYPGTRMGHALRPKPLAPLFGLAPGGVYPATDVATSAVRSYRTISPLPPALNTGSAVYFLWHFPWTHAPQVLPGTLPAGARTFLPLSVAEGGGCLANSQPMIILVFTDAVQHLTGIEVRCRWQGSID